MTSLTRQPTARELLGSRRWEAIYQEPDMSYILCHKCGGVLSHIENKPAVLSGCFCINGWVREHEPVLTFQQAVEAQIKTAEDHIKLYAAQGRPEAENGYYHHRIKRLKTVLSQVTPKTQLVAYCIEPGCRCLDRAGVIIASADEAPVGYQVREEIVK